MTSSNDTKSAMPMGLKILLGMLAGCGCLGFGVVVLGIVAAIFIPSMVNENYRINGIARETKAHLSAMNRANQVYLLENGHFTDDVEALDLGFTMETEDYRYFIDVQPSELPSVRAFAMPLDDKAGLKSYTSALFAVPNSSSDALTPLNIICESDQPGPLSPAMPAAPSSLEDVVECPPGSSTAGY